MSKDTKEFYEERAKVVRITLRKQMIIYLMMPYLFSHPRILDVGCGDGYLTLLMSGFARVTGFDRNVTSQQKHFPNVKFISGESFKDLPDEQYDIVTVFDVFEHIPEKGLLIKEIVSRAKKLLIANLPEQEDRSQPVDDRVLPSVLTSWMLGFGFHLIKLENYRISEKESYNFLVYAKNA